MSVKFGSAEKIAYESFPYFASVVGEHVLSQFELRPGERFVWKSFHVDWCDKIQRLRRYAWTGFRGSMKSTILKLYKMWRLYRLLMGEDSPEYWGFYLSYNDDLAAMHTSKLKDYILGTKLFEKCESLSPSTSIVRLRLPNGKFFLVEPKSIRSQLRGPHPDDVCFDDILGDVAQNMRLDATQVLKVNALFLGQVVYIPRQLTGKLVGTGTPQMYGDLFDVLTAEGQRTDIPQELRWRVERLPVENIYGKSVMPERYPDNELQVLRGEEGTEVRLAYRREMLCQPARETLKSWLPRHYVDETIGMNLPITQPRASIGALDLGKRRHPAHLVFFVPIHGTLQQIHSQWFDGEDYTKIMAVTCELCEYYNCIDCLVDNTRADLETFEEQRVFLYHEPDSEKPKLYTLHPSIRGIPFSTQLKWKIAQMLYGVFENHKIWLLPDDRQKRQLLCVGADLQAPETAEGHGEPFTTIGLTIKSAIEHRFLSDSLLAPKPKLSEEERLAKMVLNYAEESRKNQQYDPYGMLRLQ